MLFAGTWAEIWLRLEAERRKLSAAMSRIPVPSHTRTLQEPISFPQERAISPVPSSRHNTAMSSLSGHSSPAGGKKLSKRALGDEVCFLFS